ncbi:DUF7483 domain-containing protein [Thalassospira xiamenensis]|uniref:DUF7483 domain-containing protein n=1 Tax=Thalassospira xiamenensis TaxID=220697 RepID=A0A367XKE4_9PROT|nr:LamG-like jellyroll fold domain-containing protein [Thalassospira xiamenensis]KZB51137.1 hypothetical protein AUP41_08510 [Thalassospira xiamenensis]RCK53212.1 hypothetical protein TH44_03205 [Thalassospira xiamenensis]
MSILFDNPPPAIGCGDPGDTIDFACLFTGPEYLTRTPAAAGNRRTFTVSFWAKLTTFTGLPASDVQRVLSCSMYSTTEDDCVTVGTSSGAAIRTGGTGNYHSALYDGEIRDTANWAHYVAVFDTTQPLLSDRLVLYVNGERQAAHSAAGAGLAANAETMINSTSAHRIGRAVVTSIIQEGYGRNKSYLAELILVDGQSLAPTAFAYRNTYGHWVPKRYEGEYGAQGFHLNFADPLDLGKDVSNKGNHWSSVGLTTDNQVTDTPTNNKSSLTPFVNVWGTKPTLSQGNRRATFGSGAYGYALGDMPVASGRWHFQAELVAVSANADTHFGISGASDPSNIYIHLRGSSLYQDILVSDGRSIPTATILAAGDKVKVVFDLDTREFWVAVNDVWLINEPTESGISLPANMTGFVLPHVGQHSSTAGASLTVDYSNLATDQGSGTRSLTATSRPCPEILNPDDYVTTRIRTGGEGVSDLPFNPITNGAVVISHRLDIATGWRVNDSVTGVVWETNTANAELVEPDGLTFTDDGYDIGANTAYQGTRIDYIFRRSPKAGFDIVPVSHVNGTPTTVPHKAGGVIDFALYFPRSGGNRRLFHKALGSNAYIRLNNNAGSDPGTISETGCFQSTANTLTLGANTPTGDGVLFVWRSVRGFSAFDKYVGRNSVDGAFAPFDFSPRLCLFRLMGAATNGLYVIDTDRDSGNPVRSNHIMSIAAAQTQAGNDGFDMVSNGLKFRAIGGDYSGLGNDHIICAWAQTPGKFARAR